MALLSVPGHHVPVGGGHTDGTAEGRFPEQDAAAETAVEDDQGPHMRTRGRGVGRWGPASGRAGSGAQPRLEKALPRVGDTH